jgi:maltose alpha-D-glucosyltransferase/alpha-amylase
MGDNIYLGDRDGVRTPMQWSADRNAGFSKADFAQLYFPVIMDPVYGYQSVNVEAQLRYESSLLHWMRSMLMLRKKHHVFGRGSVSFIKPENRTIFSFVRSYEGESVLCIYNLSRFPQAAQLNLHEFDGKTPIEMMGHSVFPTIGPELYPLALGPYGFYWLQLT